MVQKKEKGWRNWGDHPIPVLISIAAGLIAIFAFITGRQNIQEMFPTAPPPSTVLKDGDIVALKNLGPVDGPRWLHSRASDNWVDLALNPSGNTNWQVVEISEGVFALKSLGDVNAYLNCRTGDGWVNLSTNLEDSGTKWQAFEVGNGIATLKCLGHIDGPRWLNGITESGIVKLADQADEQTAGTWWEIVR